ncbi:hypothetical protein [Isoptericola croceus]|uniref:hypothetical protein n=1 Tax=Isoptericola croceus TaxID=3031406 RepID=UPI0023F7FC8B|nr:hypothetical protein [Isoptericola croceus]
MKDGRESDERSISYEDLAEGMLELASAWDAVAAHCGDATPATSRCAHEAGLFPPGVEAPQELTRAIAQDAVVYVTAAVQHLRALARLLGPEIVIAGWSLTRSLEEYCGRTSWLLSPDATPLGRVARFYMERVVSLHMAKTAETHLGNRERAKTLKGMRTAVLGQARQVFPDAEMFKADELNNWAIGGEPYSGLRKAVNDFGQAQMGARGLYDMLSTFTHPSLYQLGAQTQVTELDDRRYHRFTAEPGVVRWQLAAASGSVYRAAKHVISYLELDDAPLEQWADCHPALLRWSPEPEDGAA